MYNTTTYEDAKVITVHDSPALAAWVEDLRTTDARQAQGYLVVIDNDGDKAYCCLGRACLCAGQVLNEWGTFYDEVAEDELNSLPGEQMLRWLGVKPSDTGPDYDLNIAWGDVTLRGDEHSVMKYSASDLNDSMKLTFEQIADVVAYFGILDRAR